MAWKKPESQKLLLPSGNEVELVEADILGMVMANDSEDVPDFITSQLMGGVTGKPGKQALEITKGDLPGLARFIDMVVMAGVVNYKVVKEGADEARNEINVGDISFADKFLIFQVVMPMGEANAALSFRERIEKASMGSLQYQQDNG